MLRRTLIAVTLAIPIALLGAVGWLLGSEAGLRFALARAGGALGAELVFEAARGRIAGPLELEGVSFVLGRTRIEIARLRVDLRPAPLLLGRLQLIALEAEGVRITTATDPQGAPFVLPPRIDLPVHLALERFALRDVELRFGTAAPLAFTSISGAARADAEGLRLDDLVVEHARGTLRGHGALDLAQPYPIEGALDLTLVRPGAPPLLATLAIGGRLEALALRASVGAPLGIEADLTLHEMFSAPRVSGTVTCDHTAPGALDAAFVAFGPTEFDCRLALDARSDRTTVRGRLRAVHPDWRPAVLELALTATPQALRLERSALRFEGAALTATLSGRLALDRAAHPFALAVEARELQVPSARPGPVLAARATLAAEGDLDAARATLTVNDSGAGVAELAATLAPRTGRFALEAKATEWALAGATLSRATAHAEGDARGADLTLAATVRARQQEAQLEGHGRLTPTTLVLDALHVELLGGRLDGRAEVAFGAAPAGVAGPRWHATFAARDIDPRGLDARYPGRLTARIAVEGTPAGSTLDLSDIGGTLRQRALGGGLRLRYAAPAARVAAIGPSFAPTLALEHLQLTSAGARLEAEFDARRLRFKLAAPDLQDVLANGRGQLTAEAALVDRAGSFSAQGAALALGRLRAAKLAVSASFPADGAVSARAETSGLEYGDLTADRIVLAADGPREQITLRIEAELDKGRLVAAGRGAFEPRGFVGELSTLEVVPAEGAAWRLAQPAALRVGRDGLRIAEACLSDGRGRGCLGGAWHPLEPWRIAGQVHELAVGTFGRLLARGLEYQGTFDLDFDVNGRGPELGEARAVLTLSAGRIAQPARRLKRRGKDVAADAAVELLAFDGGRIEITRHGDRTGLEARFVLTGGGRLDAGLTVVGSGPFAQRPLAGKLTANLDQFALVPALLPELRSVSGRVKADLALSGTVGAPHYAGRIAFEDGAATLPQYGLELTEIGATLEGDGAALSLSGQVRSGGLLQWHADMRQQDGRWRANGRLWGERVRVMDTPEARVVASPALLLDLDGNDLKLTGEVAVPSARLAPRSMASAVQSTGDEVIVDSGGDGSRPDALRLDARVRLKLGDEVAFDGFGLKAKVRGEIMVTERPDSLAIASGELSLAEGKYQAYGQDLTIERGRLLFSGGPVGNPGLDVRARRIVERPDASEDVIVGIDVRGTLRSPETSVFATPAMSSSDALSYLVVGRPLADSTDAEQKQLSDAASQMKMSGGEFLAQQIGRRIGIDEVRVTDSDDPAEAQLWLGTYLSPRLFVSYGMGLFEQFHTARVRYSLSSKWSVEAESGRESSADVKYTIER